jgi:hypothetical protein
MRQTNRSSEAINSVVVERSNCFRLIQVILLRFSELCSTNIESPSTNLLKFELAIGIWHKFTNPEVVHSFVLLVTKMIGFKLKLLRPGWRRVTAFSSVVQIIDFDHGDSHHQTM